MSLQESLSLSKRVAKLERENLFLRQALRRLADAAMGEEFDLMVDGPDEDADDKTVPEDVDDTPRRSKPITHKDESGRPIRKYYRTKDDDEEVAEEYLIPVFIIRRASPWPKERGILKSKNPCLYEYYNLDNQDFTEDRPDATQFESHHQAKRLADKLQKSIPTSRRQGKRMIEITVVSDRV